MSTPKYLDISKRITSRDRLKCLKDTAQKNGTNWRKERKYKFGNWRAAYCAGLNQGFNNAGNREVPVWYTHDENPIFKREKKAHEILDLRHTGYYTDEDCSELAIGIVARLSHNRFIVGYEWTDNGERVYFGDIYTDEDEAARAADHYAENFAELSREDSYKWNEARDIEQENEEKEQRLRECIALRNKSCMDYVREEIHELIEKIRENRERLSNEFGEYC